MSDSDHPKVLFYVLMLLVIGAAIAAWRLGWFRTVERAIQNTTHERRTATSPED